MPAPASLTFRPLDLPAEREALARWIAAERWPFHGRVAPTAEDVLALVDAGHFASEDAETHWALAEDGDRVGLVRAFDLGDVDDGDVLIDLRVRGDRRGRGVGTACVRWLTAHLFERFPGLQRVTGITRADNIAMRRVLRACGYAKEGHFRGVRRETNAAGEDSVQYAILRDDWRTGKTTPVRWDDEPRADPAEATGREGRAAAARGGERG